MYLWNTNWKIYVDGAEFVDSDYDEFEGNILLAEAEIRTIINRLCSEINKSKPSLRAEVSEGIK